MNRILFEKSEIDGDVAVFDDFRAEHVRNILKAGVGDTLKTGEVDGKIGHGTILAMEGNRITIQLEHDEESLQPWCDLVLAPPRPRVMKRLLPQLASMGVGRIFLVGARKVEKDFWGATLLKEENLRPLLMDGLMQAGTSILPRVEIRRNMRKFLAEELESAYLESTADRIIAHPYAAGEDACNGASVYNKERARTCVYNKECAREGAGDAASRVLLAVGPEGGWTEEEVALFESHGFRRYSLGKRILRTDTALIALLATFYLPLMTAST